MGELPLRQGVIDAVYDRAAEGCHAGLAFNKFVNTWLQKFDNGRLVSSFSSEAEQRRTPKKEFFDKIVKLMVSHRTGAGSKLYGAFFARRCRLFETLRQADWDVKSLPLATDWRLVSGLGIAHPFETGLIFDHTYGVPYLPGSSVKGAARAWAEETGWDYGDCVAVFGPDDHPPKEQPESKYPKKPFVPAQGHVVFFDAYPLKWPELEVDILNPHYKAYYDGKEPPADWLSPEPTYFLTVKAGQPWEFVIGVPPESEEMRAVMEKVGIADRQKLLDLAKQAVQRAATDLGLGGKTAVGYGYFK